MPGQTGTVQIRGAATQVSQKIVIPHGRRLLGYVSRGALTAGAILLWLWTQTLIGRRPSPTAGIGDALLDWTNWANAFLHLHPTAANSLLIASSAILDGVAVFLLASWVLGSSVRPFLSLVLVLGLRQLLQGVVSLPAPPGMIWHYPGFPSLLVTYSVSNDYYFSGHTAIAVTGAIELIRSNRRYLFLPALSIVAFEIGAVIVLRAHYTMDVFTGLIAALLSAYCAAKVAPLFDEWLQKRAL